MKIYFAGSIRGGRGDKEYYFSIIKMLEKYGKVLTEHVGSQTLTEHGETNLKDNEIFSRDMKWVAEADVLVAEVTTTSLGVGYEIGQAHAMNKPILCLYRKQDGKRLSGMLLGNPDLKICEYQVLEEVPKILEEFFNSAKI